MRAADPRRKALTGAIARVAAVAALLVSAACGTGADPGRDGASAGDTATGVQPRSEAEIEREAEPMTPEQAEELGVIDTTIQVTEEP